MRIPDIVLKGKKDPGLIDFMDYCIFILNNGLYQMRTIDSVPAWTANEGEFLCYSDGSDDRRLYIYVNTQWNYIQFTASGYPGIPGDDDTYWYYNSTTGYLECWITGIKRMEM